jgi:RimJ/RimL family protein N-acetyltransferase
VITLRPMTAEDAPLQHRLLSRTLRYPVSYAAVEARLREAPAPSFASPRFTVVRDGEAVGCVVLDGVTPESRNADLDLLLDSWDYGAEVVETVCRWAFDAIGLHRVQAWARDPEVIAAYEAASFVREGVVRDRTFRGGRWHDEVLLGRLA